MPLLLLLAAAAAVCLLQGHTNFAIVSNAARTVSLVLFTEEDLAGGRITYEIVLDPKLNRTGDVWHIRLPDLDPSLVYGYRVTGPSQKKMHEWAGHRCDEVRGQGAAPASRVTPVKHTLLQANTAASKHHCKQNALSTVDEPCCCHVSLSAECILRMGHVKTNGNLQPTPGWTVVGRWGT
jgi:pullulanase/glycogen debranching enzyme